MLAIKGKEMPTGCLNCQFLDHEWYSCAITPMARTVLEYDQRAKDCPLVEIVTCKECKNWEKDLSPRVPTNKEYHFCPMADCYTSDGFYCGSGERREE